MYIRGKGATRLIVGVYVDDLIITGGNAGAVSKFKAEMMNTFRMSDLGLLLYYLGLEVAQGADGITLRQGASPPKFLRRRGWVPTSQAPLPWR